MKKIKLTQGQVAIVDDNDYEWLSQWKWYAHKRSENIYYAARRETRNGKRAMVAMHREIIKTPEGMHTDHMNGNGLDNRRQNLRICTNRENRWNQRKQKQTSSKYKGVSWRKAEEKWRAQIGYDGKRIHLGYFDKEEDAHQAYCKAAKRFHGEFARFK